jgi:hypothetical protein
MLTHLTDKNFLPIRCFCFSKGRKVLGVEGSALFHWKVVDLLAGISAGAAADTSSQVNEKGV